MGGTPRGRGFSGGWRAWGAWAWDGLGTGLGGWGGGNAVDEANACRCLGVATCPRVRVLWSLRRLSRVFLCLVASCLVLSCPCPLLFPWLSLLFLGGRGGEGRALRRGGLCGGEGVMDMSAAYSVGTRKKVFLRRRGYTTRYDDARTVMERSHVLRRRVALAGK